MARIVSIQQRARIPQPTMDPCVVDYLDCAHFLLDSGRTLELRIRQSDDSLFLILDGDLIAWLDGRLLRSREISTE